MPEPQLNIGKVRIWFLLLRGMRLHKLNFVQAEEKNI